MVSAVQIVFFGGIPPPKPDDGGPDEPVGHPLLTFREPCCDHFTRQSRESKHQMTARRGCIEVDAHGYLVLGRLKSDFTSNNSTVRHVSETRPKVSGYEPGAAVLFLRASLCRQVELARRYGSIVVRTAPQILFSAPTHLVQRNSPHETSAKVFVVPASNADSGGIHSNRTASHLV